MKKFAKRLFSCILLCSILLTSMATAFAVEQSDYVTLSVPWNYISQCGSQVSTGYKQACQAFAFTYSRIILDNTPYAWTRYRDGSSGQRACGPFVAGYNSCVNTTSQQTILRVVYDNINMGRPVMLRAKGSTSFHYIVAIGYRASCDPNRLSQSDILILDPWDGRQKSLTAVPLKTTAQGQYGYWTARSGGAAVIRPETEQVAEYTITFDARGGSVSPTSITWREGDTCGKLPSPTRPGYEFLGWKLYEGSGLLILPTDNCGADFTEDTNLFALWREIPTEVQPVEDQTQQPETIAPAEPIYEPWSGWSTTPVSASATRQVETRTVKVSEAYTQYRYGRYVANGHDCWCSLYLEGLGYGRASLDVTGWSSTKYGTSGRDWSCGYCRGSHAGYDHFSSDGRPWWKEYKSPSGQSYYWEESRTVPAVYETQYRYRDRIN